MTLKNTRIGLLQLVGLLAIGVSAAWSLQVLGFGGSSPAGKLAWIVGSAMIAGAGAGMIYTANALKTALARRARHLA